MACSRNTGSAKQKVATIDVDAENPRAVARAGRSIWATKTASTENSITAARRSSVGPEVHRPPGTHWALQCRHAGRHYHPNATSHNYPGCHVPRPHNPTEQKGGRRPGFDIGTRRYEVCTQQHPYEQVRIDEKPAVSGGLCTRKRRDGVGPRHAAYLQEEKKSKAT